MSIHNTFHGTQFIAEMSNIAEKKGISLQVGTCFGEYADLISKHRAHHPIGLPFDHKQSNFQPENAFWVAGRDENGTLVHTQAMRPLDLAGLTLAGYMSRRFTDFPAAGINLDFSKSYYRPGPGARKIRGQVTYHGDFWLDVRYRGTGISGVLARFALVFNQLNWLPDYVIGIMPRPIAFKGLVQREGYMHCEPGAFNWYLPDTDKMREGFMVWMGREDIDHLMATPLQGLVA